MKVKFILVFLKAIISVILESMRDMELQGDVDADGVPLDSEYEKLGFVLSSLRTITKEFENEK